MKLQFIQDVLGQYYIGIDIDPSIPDKNGLTLNDLLEVAYHEIPEFGKYNDNLLNRNSNQYHITVFNAADYGTNKIQDNIIGTEITQDKIEYVGIGSISQLIKTTYFVVVKCPYINDIRYSHGFKDKDLHITIGFTHKDLFNARKDFPNIWTP